MVLYNPPVVVEVPKTFRMPLLCSMSRETIISVRRTLSATEIEWCGMPNSLMAAEIRVMLIGRETLVMKMIPVAVSMTLIESVGVAPRRAGARTQRSKVHQTWENNDPVVHGIDHVATVELDSQPT